MPAPASAHNHDYAANTRGQRKRHQQKERGIARPGEQPEKERFCRGQVHGYHQYFFGREMPGSQSMVYSTMSTP